jgi:hypothetical protein
MSRFHYRGPLPADSELFVGRQAELREVRDLCLGPLRSYVTLIGASQTGKTSFLYRLQKELPPQCPSVLVNLQMLPGATPAGLFGFIAAEMAKQLGLPSALATAGMVGSGPEFEQWLCALPGNTGKIAILIDAISALPDKTAIYMANVLRAVFSNRLLPGSEALGRFLFLLAGGSELLNLTMTAVSPFSNIATMVHLPDLTLGEVRQLMAYGFAGTPIKASQVHQFAEATYEQTHGHPYLTQRLAAQVDEFATKVESAPDPASVLRAREEILHNDEHIRHLCNELQDPALLHSAFQTLQHQVPFNPLSLRQERLYLLGIIRDEGGIAVPRNGLYARVVRQLAEEAGVAQAEAPPPRAAPQVAVTLLTPIIPTAFCHNLTEKEFPLVRLTVDNRARRSKPAQVYARASIEGFSDEAVSSIAVAEGESKDVTLLPRLQLGPCMTLAEIRPATLRVTVHQFGSGEEWLLHDQTYPIRLHAYDTALLGICTPDDKVVDLADHLCAFVTPHVPEVEDLLRRAVEHHPAHHMVGYQGAHDEEEARQIVREQVRAMFETLKLDAGLAYVNSPLNFGKQEGQITQRVRLPVTSLHESRSRANCIDGTVLYASLLELAGIEPLIAIVPGHAFVGWRIWQGLAQYDFLETTMTGTGDFEAALQVGNQYYAEAREKGDLRRALFHPNGFARLIDVAACRVRQIYPLM